MNIIEEIRNLMIQRLFSTEGFANVWPTWQNKLHSIFPKITPQNIFNIGDNLGSIFSSTNIGLERSQSAVAGGGANWESLVCWYLNLCNIGRRTIIIKHNKNFIPYPISEAITVNYGNFISNTESDLIAITFPDKPEYSTDTALLNINDFNGKPIQTYIKGKLNYGKIIDFLAERDFNQLEIHIIQCKTNWNDNAQIPMLWDMIYSADKFASNITIGKNGFSIKNVKRFTYSFATVPTVKIEKIKPTSTQVSRVKNLSGGNYWGLKTQSGVAASIKEMLSRNLSTGHTLNHLTTLSTELSKLSTEYSYFKL